MIVGGLAVKFGGSSLADAGQFSKAKAILSMNPRRQYVIPSAPGKRSPEDAKVTDLLYACHQASQNGTDPGVPFGRVRQRFMEIHETLKLKMDLIRVLDQVEQEIRAGASADYCASRGEYLNGLLLADYLGWRFLDAADVISFDQQGRFLSEDTHRLLSARLQDGVPTVIPGFYGAMPDGSIKTFTRGGSDISGAIVARAAGAQVYENWTDVSGFLMADPRIVESPREILTLTYKELRELSYMGASVLHEDAIFPVRKAGIPTNIRNTNDPTHPGTLIATEAPASSDTPTITGIAGKRGFCVISMEKAMMNGEFGFGRRVLSVIEEHGLTFEHMPTGIDTMCVVVQQERLTPVRESVLAAIRSIVDPETLTVHDHMAIIATVGRGMVRNPGTAARLFSSLAKAGVNVRMIDQGSSELSILVGVDDKDFSKAIQAIYRGFVD